VKVFITKITPWHPTKVALQWDIENVSEYGTFTFNIERSGAPQGPWTVIKTSLSGTYIYEDMLVDENANTLSLSRDFYYRVRAIPPSGIVNAFYSPVVDVEGQAETTITGPDPVIGYKVLDDAQHELPPLTNLQKRPLGSSPTVRRRLIRRKILREEHILLKKLAGIEFLLLKRRHYGVRCPICYDPVTREIVVTSCSTCYGTSWTGGYFTPIAMYGRRLNSQVQTGISPQTKDDVNVPRVQFLDFPKIDEGDILIEKFNNKRYLVKQRYETSLKTITVHQTVTASELERQAVEYSIPASL